MSTRTALGAYIFAGGFTVGVKRAGFDVLAHYEGNGYGADSAQLNWPELPIHVGTERWPVDAHRGKVDFVYCNPPCAIFSSMGIATTRGKQAWRNDERTSCWYHSFGLLESLRPRAIAIESVCPAYTTGRDLMDELTRRALLLGYSVTHLFIDARWFGLPQSRKRFFFVAHGPARFAVPRLNWAPAPTVGEVLREITEPGAWYPEQEKGVFAALVPHLRPGEKVVTAWMRANPPETWKRNAQGKISGRPSFQDTRLDPDTTSGAFIGNRYFHPTEPRRLGFNEMKALCGYPEDFQLAGPVSGWASLLARAVMPPVAEGLARAIDETLGFPDVRNRSELRVTLVDLREPNRAPVDLTGTYLTERGQVRLRMNDPALSPLPGRGTPAPEPVAAPVPPVRPTRVETGPGVGSRALAPIAAYREAETGSLEDAPAAIPSEPPPSPRPRPPVRPARPARPVTADAASVTAGDGPPEPGEGSGRFIQRLWLTGRFTPEQIVARVHEHFSRRKTTVSDVRFNFYRLVKSGRTDVPAWPARREKRDAR